MSLEVVETLETSTAELLTVPTRQFDLVSVIASPKSRISNQPFSWIQAKSYGQAVAFPPSRLFKFQIDICSEEDGSINFDPAQTASDLVQELDRIHSAEEDRERHLVFICYSFGCIIVKKAVKLMQLPDNKSLYEKIAGIVFIAGIHNHEADDFDKHLRNCMAAELAIPKKSRQIREWASSQQFSACKQVTQDFFNNPVYHWANANLIASGQMIKSKIPWIKKTRPLIPSYLSIPPGQIAKDPETWLDYQIDADYFELSTYPSPHAAFGRVLHNFCQTLMDKIDVHNPTRIVRPSIQGTSNDITSHATVILTPEPLSVDSRPGANELDTPRAGSIETVSLPCRTIRPYQRNKDFIGRAEALQQVHEKLTPHASREEAQSFALLGLGGMGKTQTALAYIFNHWNEFDAILWVQAVNSTKVLQTFADFACDLGLVSNQEDQKFAKDQAFRWFETTNVPWIVVFDNADRDGAQDQSSANLSLLDDFWPVGKTGSILVTSQDKRVTKTFARDYIELEPFSEDEATDLLYRVSEIPRSRANQNAALDIVRRLDKLPFTVGVAAKTIYEHSLDFEDFLRIYDNNKLLKEAEPFHGPALHYKKTLLSVWALPYDKLPAGAKDLMNIIAFMDPDSIKESMLVDGIKNSTEGILDVLSGDAFSLARGKLVISPLVFWNKTLKIMSMHRIVQQSCHYHMTASRQIAFERAVSIVSGNWIRPQMHNRRQHWMWNVQKEFIQHVLSLHNYYLLSQSNDAATMTGKLKGSHKFAELLYLAAWYYVERGFLSSAELLLETAKKICFKEVDDSELLLADIYGGYGAIDSERNRLQETLHDFQKQYEYLMKAFEKGLWNRPDVREALALGGLAQGYAGLNRYREAEEYYIKCIDAWKEAPGEPTIYTSHLGTCLAYQGKLDQADSVLSTEIKARAEQYGPQDTTSYRTALLYYAWENVKRRQARLGEAFEIAKACLHMYQQTLNKEHHCIADAYYKVAWHQNFVAEYDEALKSLNHALAIYGANEDYITEIARAKYLMGIVYTDLGMALEANDWKQQAEELRRRIMGDEYFPGESENEYDALVNFWSR